MMAKQDTKSNTRLDQWNCENMHVRIHAFEYIDILSHVNEDEYIIAVYLIDITYLPFQQCHSHTHKYLTLIQFNPMKWTQ